MRRVWKKDSSSLFGKTWYRWGCWWIACQSCKWYNLLYGRYNQDSKRTPAQNGQEEMVVLCSTLLHVFTQPEQIYLILDAPIVPGMPCIIKVTVSLYVIIWFCCQAIIIDMWNKGSRANTEPQPRWKRLHTCAETSGPSLLLPWNCNGPQHSLESSSDGM